MRAKRDSKGSKFKWQLLRSADLNTHRNTMYEGQWGFMCSIVARTIPSQYLNTHLSTTHEDPFEYSGFST